MLRFSFDAITSFSHRPLQFATLLGFAFSALAFLAIPLTIVARYADIYERGVPTTIVIVLLLGGIQLICVGIIGEYVGRIYDEVKHRPLYVVRKNGEPRRSEDRGDRRRRGRPGRRPPADRRRPRGRRLRALARPRRAGGDARRRRRPPARALLPPPVHHRPPHRRAVRGARACELEWRPSSVAMFAHGRQWPFTTPQDLLRFGPLPPGRRGCGWAPPCSPSSGAATGRRSSASPPASGSSAGWGGAPWREVWGPMLRGKFGARADEIAMVWLWNKLRLRRGEDAREEQLGYPAGSWEPLFEALRDRIEARGGRVLIDRPAVRIEPGLEVTYGRARLVPRRPRPARLRAGRRRALRPRARHRPERRLRAAHRPSRSRRSSTSPRSACCSSSTARSRASTGPTSPTASCRSWG